MATFAFSGGVAPVYGAGQKSKFRHGGTWAAGDTWSAQVTSQLTGDFTIGLGNIAGKSYRAALTFKERVILGFREGFAISAIDNATGWEEQNVGAAVFPFSTQYGAVDSVSSLSTLLGQLYVFGEKTIQSWQTDADPTKWVLSQVLDNTGTIYPRGTQSLGEIDVLYVDKSGIRSIRTRELSSDAYVNDVGTPIDSLVLAAVAALSNGYVASGIYPPNKNYLVTFETVGYWLAQYPMSKITAWTSFDTTRTEPLTDAVVWVEFVDQYSVAGVALGSAVLHPLTVGYTYHWIPGASTTSLVHDGVTIPRNTAFTATSTDYTLTGTASAWVTDVFYRIQPAFTPTVIDLSTSYLHAFGSDHKLYSLESVADYSVATAETAWMDVSNGKMVQFEALEVICSGSWLVYYATNPQTSNYVLAMQTGATGSVASDSTRDKRRFAISGNGSSIRLKFVSSDNGVTTKLCSAAVIYKPSNEK